MTRPRCAICGKPATCLGRYEDPGEPEYACDDCCGHGNEDGWCNSIKIVGPCVQCGKAIIGDSHELNAGEEWCLACCGVDERTHKSKASAERARVRSGGRR